MSQMLPAGLPTLSQKTARVWSSISFSIASGAIRRREADGDALVRQQVGEQRVGGAVELRNRDDVAAQLGEVERPRSGPPPGPRLTHKRVDSSLERGDAPLQHRGGRVADAGVAIALDLEIEQRRSMVGAVERIRDRLIDRHGHGLRRRIDLVAAVNGDRLASSRCDLGLMPGEPAHLAHDPLDVGLRGPETRDARAQDRRRRRPGGLPTSRRSDARRAPRGTSLATRPSRVKHTSGSGVRLTMRHPARSSDSRSTSPMRAWCSIISTYPDSPCCGERQEQLQADEPPRPLDRGGVRIDDRSRRSSRHVGGLRAERLADGVGMPAEEHPGAHRHREPFVRVARDRVGGVDAGEMAAEARREDGGAAPGRVDVEPQILRPAEARQIAAADRSRRRPWSRPYRRP